MADDFRGGAGAFTGLERLFEVADTTEGVLLCLKCSLSESSSSSCAS